MKAISVKPPWPSLIFRDVDPKDVENRTWTTNYRGPLVIHASKNWDHDGADFLKREMGIVIRPEDVTFGALIGVVLLDSVAHVQPRFAQRVMESKWAFGPYCWVMAEPRLFPEPITWRGRQGLFDVPDDVVREALEGP